MMSSEKLTDASRSFSTLVLCSRHCWEAHVVIGLVLGGGVRAAGLGFGLCLLPAIATSLLPTAAAHGLRRRFLRRGGKSSAHARWCGRFTGKRRASCKIQGKEGWWVLANRIQTCFPKREAQQHPLVSVFSSATNLFLQYQAKPFNFPITAL